jgi:hypothetical protein
MPVQLTTARHLAKLVINMECCLYSQWFAGDFNTVSDCLSRDFHLKDSLLTLLVKSCVPHQIPFGFNLYPLPTEIVFWLTCLLSNQPLKEVWSKEQTRSKLSLGEDIHYTYCPLEYKMIHSSNSSREDSDIESLQPSLQHSEKVDFLLQNLLKSEVTQSEPPWTAYHRPLGWLTSQIPDLTLTGTLHSFYSINSDATKH